MASLNVEFPEILTSPTNNPDSLHFEKDAANIKTKAEHSRIGAGFLVVLKVHFTVERKTAFPIDNLDTSNLSLFDEDRSLSAHKQDRGILWIARKRRRRGPRSVSGRSSDRSGTRLRCCSVGASAACGTCSDFPMAPGTDSSGELFVNGDVNWAFDVSEAVRNLRRERDGGSAKSYLGDEFDEEEEDQRLLSNQKYTLE
nr:LIM domain-containing protein [Ipomoea batatas]